jgi:PAS domain S-box-containing protein
MLPPEDASNPFGFSRPKPREKGITVSWEKLFSALPGIVAVFNRSGELIYGNRAYLTLPIKTSRRRSDTVQTIRSCCQQTLKEAAQQIFKREQPDTFEMSAIEGSAPAQWYGCSVTQVHDQETGATVALAHCLLRHPSKVDRFLGFSGSVPNQKKTEVLLSAQRDIFELLVAGESLGTALRTLVNVIETLVDGVIASVLLLDEEEKHLWTGAAPNLPEAYNQAIHGAPIGPDAGSCGTSAYQKKLIIVTDTYSDFLWKKYKSLAKEHGLRACWSSPIFSRAGKVLGTFAMYFRSVRSPNEFELQLVKDATAAAALSIEHVKMRESLAKTVSLLNSTIESSADGILVTDLDGSITNYNQRFIQMFKVPKDRISYHENNICNLIKIDFLKDPGAFKKFQDLGSLNSEIVGILEFKDGKIFELSSIPQRLEDKVVGRVWTFRDITERKSAEEKIRRSEEQFRATFEMAAVGKVQVDPVSLKITSANRKLCELTGYTSAELSGLCLLQLIHPDDRSKESESFERMVRGELESYSAEKRVLHKSGVIIWVNITIAPIRDSQGVTVSTIGVIQDFTDRKKAEEDRDRLLKQETRLRENATFLADAGKVLASSLNHKPMLQDLCKLIASRLADWCFIGLIEKPGDLQTIAAAGPHAQEMLVQEMTSYRPDMAAPEGLPKAIRLGCPLLYREVTNDRLYVKNDWPVVGTRDPHYLEVIGNLGLKSFMTIPMFIRGEIIGGIFIASSSSERQYDNCDLELATELAQSCAIAIDNCNHYREAQRAIGVRDDFISIASHELRTPLTPLKMQIQLLTKYILNPSDSSPTRQSTLNNLLLDAEYQMDRLLKLVENLLDVSRMNAGRLVLSRERVDLGELVFNTIKQFSTELEAAHCSLNLTISPNIIGIWDRLRIEQVVINLLTNAIKYGRGKPIKIYVGQQQGNAILTVIDQGIGISVKDQEKIFGRFERAASIRTFGGLGLGLYISQQIVESHRGTIFVKSELGKGATFQVLLPLKVDGV